MEKVLMDDEMIERVSRAILSTPNASDYKKLVAVNAIKAMQEPTESIKQIEAGSIDYSSSEIWRLMIGAIIND